MNFITTNNKIIIDAVEETKSYVSIGIILEQIIQTGFSKNNKLVAIGGGRTQDVTSFAASILMRGVDWTFFPTNIASQCDSCIGSKTSVNLGSYKNQLGGFYPPKEIFVDFSFRRTLSNSEVRSGLGEMMHYFLVDGPSSLDILANEIGEAKNNDQILFALIDRSLRIKKSMVEIDEFDQGPRRVFNYGHTFGHALEAATNFKLPHGIAVAYGIDLANLISVKLGFVDVGFRNKVRPILQDIFDIFPIPSFTLDVYLAALARDKKNISGKLNAVLTRGPGDMFQTPVELSDEIHNVIAEFFNSKTYEKSI
jgi:3-dehydroquinate synthase